MQPAAMGTYTKVAGLIQWDRPVYQRVGRPVYPYTPMLYLFYDYQYLCEKTWGGQRCTKHMGQWLIGKDYTRFNDPAPANPGTAPPGPSDAAFKLVWSDGPGGPQCPEFVFEWAVKSIHERSAGKFPMTVSALRAGALQAESAMPCIMIARAIHTPPVWPPARTGLVVHNRLSCAESSEGAAMHG